MRAMFLVAAIAVLLGFLIWARAAQKEDCLLGGGRWVVSTNGDAFCLPPQGEP